MSRAPRPSLNPRTARLPSDPRTASSPVIPRTAPSPPTLYSYGRVTPGVLRCMRASVRSKTIQSPGDHGDGRVRGKSGSGCWREWPTGHPGRARGACGCGTPSAPAKPIRGVGHAGPRAP